MLRRIGNNRIFNDLGVNLDNKARIQTLNKF